MEYIDLDQYVDKQTGDTLEATDWNSLHVTIQDKVNEIINTVNVVDDSIMLSLTADTELVFVGKQSTIEIEASTNIHATNIKIERDFVQLASGSGMSLNCSDIIVPLQAGNITYRAEFIINGLQKTITKNVAAVYPIKYGSGQFYIDATTEASARTTTAGTYNVTVSNDEDYIFFNIPATMTINKATMGGLDFYFDEPENIKIGGVDYKSYKSSNTYDAGILTIIIS